MLHLWCGRKPLPSNVVLEHKWSFCDILRIYQDEEHSTIKQTYNNGIKAEPLGITAVPHSWVLLTKSQKNFVGKHEKFKPWEILSLCKLFSHGIQNPWAKLNLTSVKALLILLGATNAQCAYWWYKVETLQWLLEFGDPLIPKYSEHRI